MRIPLSWLREMTPVVVEAPELAAVLGGLGLPVGGMERVGAGLEAIVVAEVLEVGAIEGADRIRFVTVDAGDRQLGIVCGAWNFGVGDRVPLAPVGTVLPGGMEIGRRKIRGVVSDGMLCSGRELGLTDDGAGLLVLGTSASGAAAPGTPIVEALGIVPDVVLDLEAPANRADCLSVAGVAREIAAALRLPFALPAPAVVVAGPPASASASVAVEAPHLCTRLTARVLTGIVPVPSPPEVARRLVLCGMRPIDAVVDASNYVMLELGQPTHPYDLDRLGRGIVARAARSGERIVTLDGVERALSEDDCVIADAEGRAVGVGGVMGGSSTGITPTTSRVLLEAAHFVPAAVAGTSERLGLTSEASLRFARGADPEMPELAGARYAGLLVAAAVAAGVPPPAMAPGLLDARPVPTPPVRVTVRTYRVNAMLGTDLADDAVRGQLERLGFGVTASARSVSKVTVPSHRPDVTLEADLVEEVARHLGYDHIPWRARRAPGSGALSAHQRRRRALRRILCALGAHEVWTPRTATAADAGAGRSSLLPGLLGALASNAAHRDQHLRVFEVGRVLGDARADLHDEVLNRDHEVAAVLLALADDGADGAVRAWHLVADGLGVRGVEMVAAEHAGLHPTRAARLVAAGSLAGGSLAGAGTESAAGETIGWVGEVDPSVAGGFGLANTRLGWLELATVPLLAFVGARRAVPEPSRYPSADVDLAFVLAEDVPAASLEACLHEAAGELCESVELFDVYRGAGVPGGERSLAYRLRLSPPDHTLTDGEIAGVRQSCVTAAGQSLKARLRG